MVMQNLLQTARAPSCASLPLNRASIGFAIVSALLLSSAASASGPRLILCQNGFTSCQASGIEVLSPLSYDQVTGVINAVTPGGNLRCGTPDAGSAEFRLRLDGQEYPLASFPGPGGGQNRVLEYRPGDSVVGWEFLVDLPPGSSASLFCEPVGAVQTLLRVRTETDNWNTEGHLGASTQLQFGQVTTVRTRSNAMTPMFCSSALAAGLNTVFWSLEDSDGRSVSDLRLQDSALRRPFELRRDVVPATLDVQTAAAARCVSWRDNISGTPTPLLTVDLRQLSSEPGPRGEGQPEATPAPRPGPVPSGQVLRYELLLENSSDVERLINVVEYFPYATLTARRFGGVDLVQCILTAPSGSSECGTVGEALADNGEPDSAAARVEGVRVAPGEAVKFRFDREVREDLAPGTGISTGVAVFVMDDADTPTRIDDARVVLLERVVGGS